MKKIDAYNSYLCGALTKSGNEIELIKKNLNIWTRKYF